MPRLAAVVLDTPVLDDDGRRVVAAGRDGLVALSRAARRVRRVERVGCVERVGRYLSPDEAHELLAEYRRRGKERSASPRELLMPLRRALTGREHGPELHYVLAALSADATFARLDHALAQITSATTEGDRR